jgi:secretion/DNA translocation related TadE-like protein
VNRSDRPERGAATVLMVGVIAVVVAVATFAAGLGLVVTARHRASAAADAAALAAADTALGATSGIPCERAATVAVAAGVHLAACRQEGVCARVEVRLSVLTFEVRARSRAGPPGGRTACQPADRLRRPVDPAVYGVRDPRPLQRFRAVGSREGKGGRPCPAPRSS